MISIRAKMFDVPEQTLFMERTQEAYAEQRRRARAAGQDIDYRIQDLRAYVWNNLGDRRCYYCCGPVRTRTFALDQKVPPLRGGSFAFHNLAIVCQACYDAKGHLDYIEYKELMGLLRSWSPFMRKNLLARLQAAGPLTDHLYLRALRPIPDQPGQVFLPD